MNIIKDVIAGFFILTFSIALIPNQASAKVIAEFEAYLINEARTNGVPDQHITVETTQSGFAGISASIIVEVADVPDQGDQVTIGNCVISFQDTAGETVNELDCGDNSATIDLSLGADNTPIDPTSINATLSSLTNVTDGLHGELIMDIDHENLIFSSDFPPQYDGEINNEGLAGIINFDSSAAVAEVPQITTLTFSGTPERFDVFSFTVEGGLVGPVSHEVGVTDTTLNLIADSTLNEYLQNEDYESEEVTATLSESGDGITLTSKSGTDHIFSVSAETSNRYEVRQLVEYRVGLVTPGKTYVAEIDNQAFEFDVTDQTEREITTAIHEQMLDNDVADCVIYNEEGEEDRGVYIECSAFEPGVEFQFDAYTYLTPERKTGGSSSGTKVTMRKLPTAKPLTSVSTSTATSTASTTDAVEVRDLYFGLTGDDVVKLQQILISTATGSSSEALAKVGATGYFGPLTQAALAEWQAANGVTPALGYFGTITRAKMKTLALAGIWW